LKTLLHFILCEGYQTHDCDDGNSFKIWKDFCNTIFWIHPFLFLIFSFSKIFFHLKNTLSLVFFLMEFFVDNSHSFSIYKNSRQDSLVWLSSVSFHVISFSCFFLFYLELELLFLFFCLVINLVPSEPAGMVVVWNQCVALVFDYSFFSRMKLISFRES
jgi:hypothetical protein